MEGVKEEEEDKKKERRLPSTQTPKTCPPNPSLSLSQKKVRRHHYASLSGLFRLFQVVGSSAPFLFGFERWGDL
jgi:hypothetical protein